MHWVITVWLLVMIYPSLGKVITVDNAGVYSGKCCEDGICPCSSLARALQSLKNDTVIQIASESVVLETIIHMGSVHNITIIGNNATIRCNNIGAINCASCSDIIIEGLIWDQNPGLMF